jgi:hypothetical protein
VEATEVRKNTKNRLQMGLFNKTEIETPRIPAMRFPAVFDPVPVIIRLGHVLVSGCVSSGMAACCSK